jgi:hypothetical protein
MDIEETLDRLKVLSAGSEIGGKAQTKSIGTVLDQPAISQLVQCVLLYRLGLTDEMVAFIRKMPVRPPAEKPLAATELSPRLVELLNDHGVFTLGEAAELTPTEVAAIPGMGVMYTRDLQLVFEKYLGIRPGVTTKRQIEKRRAAAGG